MTNQELTPMELELMSHAVGHRKRSGKRPAVRLDDCFRNNYACDTEDAGATIWQGLVTRGLAVRGRSIPGGLVYFYVNADGFNAILAAARKNATRPT